VVIQDVVNMVNFGNLIYEAMEEKYKDKPIFFCLIGDSGSGKTFVANTMKYLFGIPLQPSYTTRPKRGITDTAHIFLTEESFDNLIKLETIAITEYGGYRYAGLLKDVKPAQVYVIDEIGYRYFKRRYSDRFTIIAIKVINRHNGRVDQERVNRDVYRSMLPAHEFDHVIYNSGLIMLMTQLLIIMSDYIPDGDIKYVD